MKILKRGELPKPALLRGQCYKCGVIFEVDENESNVEFEEDRNITYDVWTGKCPTDGCNVDHIYLYKDYRWKDRNLLVKDIENERK